MSEREEVINVVEWNNRELELKKENVKRICAGIANACPIAIMTVCGAYRSAKSALLNLFISILKLLELNSDTSRIHVDDLKLNNGCLNEDRENIRGFGWKAGNIPCTKGIRMLNHAFIIPNPGNRSQKMAVLLVDTEGLEANDSRNGSDEVLFGISNLMSSLLIVNQKGIIGPSDMTNLRLLTEFCPPERSRSDGLFCRIELLMRDFKYGSDNKSDQLEEMKEFKKKLFIDSRDESLRNNLEIIKSCYKSVDCFGLPYPGNGVLFDDYDGDMSKYSNEFKELVLHYILEILTQKLHPTFENKESLFSLCEDLNEFLSRGIPQLSQMHKIFLENQNKMLLDKIMNELMNPLKSRVRNCNGNAAQLKEDCINARQKVNNEYANEFVGTEEMIKEKISYILNELQMLERECDAKRSYEIQEEQNRIARERQAAYQKSLLERQRIASEIEQNRLNEEMRKVKEMLNIEEHSHHHHHHHHGCNIQ